MRPYDVSIKPAALRQETVLTVPKGRTDCRTFFEGSQRQTNVILNEAKNPYSPIRIPGGQLPPSDEGGVCEADGGRENPVQQKTGAPLRRFNKNRRVTAGNGLDRSERENGLPRLLRRLAKTEQCHSERSEESVFPQKDSRRAITFL